VDRALEDDQAGVAIADLSEALGVALLLPGPVGHAGKATGPGKRR
jgi:hypothetical protein